SMATADGLGHFSEEIMNDSTAIVSFHACEEFVNVTKSRKGKLSASELPKIIKEIGEHSKQSRLSYGTVGQVYDSKSSLIAATATRTEDGLKGALANAGDGVMIVVDHKTKTVKQVLNARNYKRPEIRAVSYNPTAVQDLTEETLAQVENTEMIDIAEDDIVIQMTDGAWSELNFTTEEKGEYRESKLDTSAINKLLEEILSDETSENGSTYVSAYQLADKMLTHVSSNTLKARADFANLYITLQPYITAAEKRVFEISTEAEFKAYNLSVWLDEIEKENPGIVEQLKNLLLNPHHDGRFFYPETPLKFIINHLEYQSFGDCTTIAVMRVPNYKVELVRALIQNPQKGETLLPRIVQAIPPKEELDYVISRLKNESHIERPDPDSLTLKDVKGSRCNDINKNLQLTYTPEECEVIKKIIISSHIISVAITDQQPNKSERLEIFKKTLLHPNLPIQEMSILFDAFKSNERLNTHTNPFRDTFFGIKNTASWRDTWKELRDTAKQKLFDAVDKLTDTRDKMALLNWAEEQPLFCEHRNNSILCGAWGRTQAVRDIQEKFDQIEKMASVSSPKAGG
ncbi:MAG: hypothetical protein WBE18_06005, partial [Gammaproteobacteria bacterium]